MITRVAVSLSGIVRYQLGAPTRPAQQNLVWSHRPPLAVTDVGGGIYSDFHRLEALVRCRVDAGLSNLTHTCAAAAAAAAAAAVAAAATDGCDRCSSVCPFFRYQQLQGAPPAGGEATQPRRKGDEELPGYLHELQGQSRALCGKAGRREMYATCVQRKARDEDFMFPSSMRELCKRHRASSQRKRAETSCRAAKQAVSPLSRW